MKCIYARHRHVGKDRRLRAVLFGVVCVSVNEADVDKWRVSPRETRAQAIFRALGATAEIGKRREDDEGGRKEGERRRRRRRRRRSSSQKAAPLVVRVIDDRENMRARKKDPPLAASLSYAESCQLGDCHAETVPVAATIFRSPNPSDSTASQRETDFTETMLSVFNPSVNA
ncbi:unnamed protein product [Lasius platythorax]|uniref:Uncharacterized protein n=1 Tax=Lasius platythorax TaxID=488582 RepID=A0AAV2NHX5_9HYME